MIKRYTDHRIEDIFSKLSRFLVQTKIEKHISVYTTPVELKSKLYVSFDKIDYDRLLKDIDLNEKSTKHETTAFINALLSQLPEDLHSYIHRGVTSSDVLDTCLNIQIIESHNVLIEEIDDFLSILFKKAQENKYQKIIGRSHGIHGEITTLGLGFLNFYAEWLRNKNRLSLAIDELRTCKISGAMGNYVHIDPDLEQYVASKFNLSPEPISNQVVSRDKYANYINCLSLLGASLERISTYIRLLSQSGIEEIKESFSENQTGSSAMPHKKNPILSENVSGLSRLLKMYNQASLDNVALWYERDMSHSSVERVILPDAFNIAVFSIKRMKKIIENMHINVDMIYYNIINKDLYLSQSILVALMKKGFTRNSAYSIVQNMSFTNNSLIRQLNNSPHFSEDEIKDIIDQDKFISKVDIIFNRFESVYK